MNEGITATKRIKTSEIILTKQQVWGKENILPVSFQGSSCFSSQGELTSSDRRVDILSHLYSASFSAPLSAGLCVACWNQGPDGWFLAGSWASHPGIPTFLSWCALQCEVSGCRTQCHVALLSEWGLVCKAPGLYRITISRVMSLHKAYQTCCIQYDMIEIDPTTYFHSVLNIVKAECYYKLKMPM